MKKSLVFFAFALLILCGCNKKATDETSTSKVEKEVTENNNFTKAKDYIENNEYGFAKFYFSKVPSDDKNYSEAQKLMEECDTHLTPADIEKMRKEDAQKLKDMKKQNEDKSDRLRLKQKYISLMNEAGNSSYYRFKKLVELGFYELNHGIDEYTKMDEGYLIRVTLKRPGFDVVVE